MSGPELAPNGLPWGDVPWDAPLREAAPAVLALVTPGRRVVFRHAVDRYPFALAPAGTVGTIVEAGPELVRVRPDRPLYGLGEWGGCLEWYDAACALHDCADARQALLHDLRVIA